MLNDGRQEDQNKHGDFNCFGQGCLLCDDILKDVRKIKQRKQRRPFHSRGKKKKQQDCALNFQNNQGARRKRRVLNSTCDQTASHFRCY
jgi:hypothetical protein